MLFGLIKQAGESITVDVKEWMGTNYFGAALAGAVGLFVEEATNSYVVAKLQLQEWKATAYKTLHRLIFSALYYFGGKSLFGKTAIPLTMSVFPIAMIFIDVINNLLKVESPQEAGLRMAGAFREAALASAPVVEATPVTVTSPTSAPSAPSRTNFVTI